MRLVLSPRVPVSLRLQPGFLGQVTGFLWASWPLTVPERRGFGLQGKTAQFSAHIFPLSLCLWARILSWGNAQGPPSGLPEGRFLGDSMALWGEGRAGVTLRTLTQALGRADLGHWGRTQSGIFLPKEQDEM